MSFYLVLPSNSSMTIFPNNTLADYTTKLAHPISLDGGEWEVALVEAIYPHSFHNLPKGRNTVTVGNHSMVIPSGHYKSVHHLITIINGLQLVNKVVKLKYDQITGLVHVIPIEEPEPNINLGDGIYLSASLERLFGFHVSNESLHPVSRRPANIDYFIPQQLFLYTDIVEHQLVGDTTAPLLRTLAVKDAPFGKSVHNMFTNPHYVKVQKRHFDTITVDIRDHTGKKAPFEYGTVTVKLHFRPCQSQRF